VLRLVLDTNIALSGLLWSGTPKRLIAAARAVEVMLFSSVPLLEELSGVILRGKFNSQLTGRGIKAETLFNGYAVLCRIVEPVRMQRTSVDPDDDVVLATALAVPADLIVSGDAHLLNLKTFHRIPIITAAEAVGQITQSSRR
jgi:putative PIN family toxin of toxin-antitoxin system